MDLPFTMIMLVYPSKSHLPLSLFISPQTSLPTSSNSNELYPDAICCKLSADNMKVACVYSDRSLFVWDIKNIKKIGKYRSFLSHSACVWDIDVFPEEDQIKQERNSNSNSDDRSITSVGSHTPIAFPPGTFVTCSADSTIRFWNLEGTTNTSTSTGISTSVSVALPGFPPEDQRNIFSKELLRTIYIGDDFSSMKAKDLTSNCLLHLSFYHQIFANISSNSSPFIIYIYLWK